MLKKTFEAKNALKNRVFRGSACTKKEIVENFETAPGNSKIQNFGGVPPDFFSPPPPPAFFQINPPPPRQQNQSYKNTEGGGGGEYTV